MRRLVCWSIVVFDMTLVTLLLALALLFHSAVDARRCYLCSCSFNWDTNTGTCTSVQFLSSCTSPEVGDNLCYMISSYTGNMEQRVFESIPPDAFEDRHFIQAVERISLSGTVWLPTTISSVSYGCDWDNCNEIELAQFLPDSFKMRIDQRLLNSELIDGQLLPQTCLDCSKCINDLVGIVCKIVSCPTGVCYIDELHNFITTPTNNCTYNFYSICDSFSSPPPSPNVRIRATYYIDFPAAKQLEIDEVDIACRKDNCNSIVTVEKLKQNIETTIEIPPGFRPSRLTSTSTAAPVVTTTSAVPVVTTTTAAPGVTTTTARPVTTATTSSTGASTRSYLFSFLCLMPILLLL